MPTCPSCLRVTRRSSTPCWRTCFHRPHALGGWGSQRFSLHRDMMYPPFAHAATRKALAQNSDTHVSSSTWSQYPLGRSLRLCCLQADKAIEAAIHAVLVERGQKALPALVAKVLQLWQTIQVRFGVCVLGPAASGKSTVIRTLQVDARCLHAVFLYRVHPVPCLTVVLQLLRAL